MSYGMGSASAYQQAKKSNKQYAQNELHKFLHRFAQKHLQSPQVQQFLDNYEDLITVVLTVLMTPQAEPKPAMGHHEPTGKKAQHMHEDQKILYSDSQKDDQGNSVCLDHSAMLVPSDDMKKFVYNDVLFGKRVWAFHKFGNYTLDSESSDEQN